MLPRFNNVFSGVEEEESSAVERINVSSNLELCKEGLILVEQGLKNCLACDISPATGQGYEFLSHNPTSTSRSF